MSSSLDQAGGHYALSSNSQPNPTDHSNSGSNSSGNNSNGQYGLGYSGQQQQQQQQRHPHQNYHRTQQPMFYAQQEYHQQQGMYPQQGNTSHQHQQPRHTNDQYSQPQQDLSRQNHYSQHQQHPQQSFGGYNQPGQQQGHYQDSPSSSGGRSHYTQTGQGHGGHEHDPETGYSKEKEQESGSASASGSLPPESGSNLRFKITLEAPTAAMQRQDETSLTYLNKSQFYTIGLEDTEEYNGEITSVIKVTFHEPSHRRLAARYWSFWLSQQSNPKTARALDIEKASSSGILEVQSKTFDRISFKWNGKAGAKLMVRFNCLSTDFSRIKGVKGIPLRVHMDTYLDGAGDGDKDGSSRSHDLSEDVAAMERAFAKIKLFRDKGAERKNKDDHKQLEKMWDKMRGKNADTNPLINMLAPVQSVSLFAECMDPPEGSGEEETLDLSETLTHDSQDKGGSNNGSSSGRQEAGDDGDGGDSLESYSSRQDGDSMSTASSGDPSNAVVVVTKKRRRPAEEDVGDVGPSTYESHQSQVGFVSSAASHSSAAITSGAGEVVTSSSGGSDLLLDRDMSYVPQMRKKRPVLCLYIKIGGEAVYRAVYLEKCTLADLIQKLSEKLEIQSSTISHVFRKTLKKELIVRVDDAMVGQMVDELDMVVEYDFNQQDGSVNLTLKY